MSSNESRHRPSIPRSIRHKRILDIAAANPEASTEDIAAEIPSVTAELVERVLDEYGDPADEQPAPLVEEPAPAVEPVDESMAHEQSTPTDGALTAKQREVLRAIVEQPEAPQREIAEALGVSTATISNRVNSIEGFDWENRQAAVEAIFEDDSSDESTGETPMAPSETDSSHETESATGTGATVTSEASSTNEAASASEAGSPSEVDSTSEHTAADSTPEREELLARITALEEDVATLTEREQSPGIFDDPALIHKVVHACMDSERITEDEELQILKRILA